MLGAHDIDDTSLKNTNTTDVSINTVNNEEQMTGSHITEFHTPNDKKKRTKGLLKSSKPTLW